MAKKGPFGAKISQKKALMEKNFHKKMPLFLLVYDRNSKKMEKGVILGVIAIFAPGEFSSPSPLRVSVRR